MSLLGPGVMDPKSMPATLASKGIDKMTKRSSQLGFREGDSLIVLTRELGPWDTVGKVLRLHS